MAAVPGLALPLPSSARAGFRCMLHAAHTVGLPPALPSSQGQSCTAGPLPVSLLLGLTRWHRSDRGKAAPLQRRDGLAPRADLLAHLATLLEDVILHVCSLAGLCRPVNPPS